MSWKLNRRGMLVACLGAAGGLILPSGNFLGARDDDPPQRVIDPEYRALYRLAEGGYIQAPATQLAVRVVLGLHLLLVQLVLKIRETVAEAEVQLGELKA